jgi:hypothetical protein
VAGASASLEWVDHKMLCPLTRHHLFTGLNDGTGDHRVEKLHILIDLSGCPFDEGHRPDEGTVGLSAGYRKILHRPLCLGSI